VCRFEVGVGAGDSGEFAGLVAVDEIDLRLCTFETQGKFAAVGQQGVLIEGAVEGGTQALDLPEVGSRR
jgi:hypothetical protein